MNKRFLFSILFFLAAMSAGAQKRFEYVDTTLLNDRQEQTEDYDSDYQEEKPASEDDIQGDTNVTIRPVTILPDSIAAWKSKKEFGYARNLDSLLRSQYEKEEKKEIQQPTPTYRKPANMDGLFAAAWVKITLWVLAALFVLFILYRLFFNDAMFRRTGEERKVAELATPDEHHLLSNFDQLIHQSCKLADYRVATRYLFLKTLQRLSERSLINYSIDKTNSRYLYEIPEPKRAEFASLITIYEFLWYGNNTTDKDSYTGIETKFNNFLNKI